MFRQFKFEESLYEELHQIPVSTQFKLETIGFQFPLDTWNRLPIEERWVLCHLPIRSKGEKECYCNYLIFLLNREGADPSAYDLRNNQSEKKAWDELARVPGEVAAKVRELDVPLYWPDWIKLDDMERYAIYKLCKEESADAQIQQVVQEFLGQ